MRVEPVEKVESRREKKDEITGLTHALPKIRR
jgi:hypothetical protein